MLKIQTGFRFDKHTFATICTLADEFEIAVNVSVVLTRRTAAGWRMSFSRLKCAVNCLDTAAGLQFGDNRSDKGQLNEI
jgi:hypothetical protein